MWKQRIRKVGRFWHYRPTPVERHNLREVWYYAQSDLAEGLGQPSPITNDFPTAITLGGGSLPAVAVMLDPPERFTLGERLTILFRGDL